MEMFLSMAGFHIISFTDKLKREWRALGIQLRHNAEKQTQGEPLKELK
jgi:hypothetical protein